MSEPKKKKGVISAGDERTAQAGVDILEAGGNAFDAAVGATLTSFVSESTLTSSGGGGFLMAHKGDGTKLLYDFFTQTPCRQNPSEQLDFYPGYLNFKDSRQEFKIGLAAAAVPGNIAGLLHVSKTLGRMSFEEVAQPAKKIALDGVEVTPFILYNFHLINDMILAEEASRNIYKPGGNLLKVGDRYRMAKFADMMDVLSTEGSREFYEGEFANKIVQDCQERGGHLTMDDFKYYKVIEHDPLSFKYHGFEVFTNPPPSAGGVLIAFMLKLLENAHLEKTEFGDAHHLSCLVDAIRLTSIARREKFNHRIYDEDISKDFLNDEDLEELGKIIGNHRSRFTNTTHLTVADSAMNVASITTSFGTGCGYIIPGTDCMLNNMLGEEDLITEGFHNWPLNHRITSMMSPSIVMRNGVPVLALGSGGANRIRTAILQVISNYIDFEMHSDKMVNSPRIHWEDDVLTYEPGYDANEINKISNVDDYEILPFSSQNMFFGGVHAVYMDEDGNTKGAGDRRREGIVKSC